MLSDSGADSAELAAASSLVVKPPLRNRAGMATTLLSPFSLDSSPLVDVVKVIGGLDVIPDADAEPDMAQRRLGGVRV